MKYVRRCTPTDVVVMFQPTWTTYPTWERYVVMAEHIAGLTVRDKRFIFNIIKEQQECAAPIDMLLPQFGFTIGEFAVWYMLNEHGSKRGTKHTRTKKR